MDKKTRIAIVGGGAAGLTSAWFLKQQGYQHVTVLEKLDRVGGKCKSLTFDGAGFDLGANYITSSYTKVRKLAAELDMHMFTETKGHALDLTKDRLGGLLGATTKKSGLLAVGWSALRYMWKRYFLGRKLAPKSPGFVEASRDPKLCVSFEEWLAKNGLKDLVPVFTIPLTLMGYDKLSQIPAAYALTYMDLGTFLNLMMFAANIPLRGWPKRFDLGYQRLMQRLAAQVDVLTGVDIESIKRGGEGVQITYSREEQDLNGTRRKQHQAQFDKLILACPLMPDVLDPMLDLSVEESELFAQVKVDPFVVATYATDCQIDVSAVTFMLPVPKLGEPYVITQQFREVPFLSIYTRLDREGQITREQVLENNRKLLRDVKADQPEIEPYTYDEWAYFPHVFVEQMQQGFYLKLDAMQGQNDTYYTGGLLGFELVETIAEFSEHLVTKHFGEARE